MTELATQSQLYAGPGGICVVKRSIQEAENMAGWWSESEVSSGTRRRPDPRAEECHDTTCEN